MQVHADWKRMLPSTSRGSIPSGTSPNSLRAAPCNLGESLPLCWSCPTLTRPGGLTFATLDVIKPTALLGDRQSEVE
eukprot:5506579-Pyramimonas_sp.AAC.1